MDSKVFSISWPRSCVKRIEHLYSTNSCILVFVCWFELTKRKFQCPQGNGAFLKLLLWTHIFHLFHFSLVPPREEYFFNIKIRNSKLYKIMHSISHLFHFPLIPHWKSIFFLTKNIHIHKICFHTFASFS